MNTPDLFPVTAPSLTIEGAFNPGMIQSQIQDVKDTSLKSAMEGQFPVTSASLQSLGDNPIGATYSSEGLRNTLKVYMETRSTAATLTTRARSTATSSWTPTTRS